MGASISRAELEAILEEPSLESRRGSLEASQHDTLGADGTDCTILVTLTSTPVELAAIKASERELETLQESLTAAGVTCNDSAIRQVEAQIIQSTIKQVNHYSTEVRQVLEASWDKYCEKSQLCFSLSVATRIVRDALQKIISLSSELAANVLLSVAESESDLVTLSSGGATSGTHVAKGTATRSKIKLSLQLRLQRNTEALQSAIVAYGKAVLASFRKIMPRVLRPIIEHDETLLATHAASISPPEGAPATLSSGSPPSPGKEECGIVVRREAFMRHFANHLVVQLMDPAKIVEGGSYLQHVLLSRGGPSQGGSGALNTRASLHAARLVAFADQFSGGPSASNGGVVENADEYQSLVVEAPAPFRRMFAQREKQLESLIDELHRFNCMPAMYATLTTASGGNVIELDATKSVGGQYGFRRVDVANKTVLVGRYCRISAAVIVLLAQQRTHPNGVVEYCADTTRLVREDGGWRELSSGVLFDTFIPND